MQRDVRACLLDMLLAARRALRRLGDMSEEEFRSDEDAQWYMFSQLVIIGEAANRVERSTQLQYPTIPWSEAISMRHRIVHGYDSIDWGIVYATVKDDLPHLIAAIEPLIPPEPTEQSSPKSGSH